MKKKIVIIGSGGNLGAFLYTNLKKKYNVIGVSRDATSKNLFCDDLSDFNLNFKTLNKIHKKNSKIDCMIICTGKSNKLKKMNQEEKFILSIRSNFLTVSNTIESYQKIYKNKSTKIIVLSSIAGSKVIDAPMEYSVAKSALNHYCKIKAKELSKYKINLNLISPGNILNKGNNWHINKKLNSQKVKRYIKKNVPLNSFCKPSMILSICNLLISKEGNFFQGSNIVIDGGQTL